MTYFEDFSFASAAVAGNDVQSNGRKFVESSTITGEFVFVGSLTVILTNNYGPEDLR